MDVILGGTANGKKEWVQQHYQKEPIWMWFSFYKAEISDCLLPEEQNGLLVIEAFDEAVKRYLDEPETLYSWYRTLIKWENEYKARKLIVIGTDLNKGIVPVEKKDRQLRDAVGLWYQRLTKEAAQVYEIWYGLSAKWKG